MRTPDLQGEAESVLDTPGTTITDEDVDGLGLSMRWKEAMNRCLSDLKPADREVVLDFETPEQLLADLRRCQAEYANSVTQSFFMRVIPCVERLETLSYLLVTAMPSKSIKNTLIWGLLYLAIKSSVKSNKTFGRIVIMLDKIQVHLRNCDTYARRLNSAANLRHSLVDMFEALIDFWVEAVKVLRKHPVENFFALDAAWPNLNRDFGRATQRLEEAVQQIYREASLTAFTTTEEVESRERTNASLLATLSLSDEYTSFPRNVSLPAANQHFLGRESDLNAIATHLGKFEPRNGLQSFTVFGIGGVGKTSLAVAFAHSCRAKSMYDAVCWIRSETSIALQESFTEIARALELPRASGDHGNNIILVKNWLNKTSKKWLLIYDNVEKFELLDQYLPPCPGSVLITTRMKWIAYRIGGNNEMLELSAFGEDDATALFKNLKDHGKKRDTSPDEQEALATLLGLLGGLALAIQQMAAYISYRGLTVREFLGKYDKMAPNIHKKGDGSSASHTLATCWQLSFAAIRKNHQLANTLLGIMSMCSPDVLHLDLFTVKDSEATTELTELCQDESEVEDAIDTLANYALINREGDVISLHRLVQKAFFFSLEAAERQKVFEATVKLVNSAFPKQINARPLYDRWQDCQKHVQHALTLATIFQKHNKSGFPIQTLPELGELLKNCVWYLYELGQLNDGLELLRIAYDSVPDRQSVTFAHLCNSAAVIYYEQNDLKPCRESNEKSRKIREALLGEDDLDRATSYHNLGSLASAQGRYNEALELYAKTERTYMKAGEKAEISLGLIHMMTGRVFFLREQYLSASTRYGMAEEIFARTLGPSSQLMAHLIYAFGNLEYAQGNIAAAKRVYENGHKISYDLGPTHVLTATFDYKLGVVEARLKNYTDAMARLQQALTVVEYHRARGDVARILRRQAIVIRENPLSSPAQVKEANSMLDKAETIKAAISDPGDQDPLLSEDLVYDNLVCGYFR